MTEEQEIEMRATALHLAAESHRSAGRSAREIVDEAEMFLAFLGHGPLARNEPAA